MQCSPFAPDVLRGPLRLPSNFEASRQTLDFEKDLEARRRGRRNQRETCEATCVLLTCLVCKIQSIPMKIYVVYDRSHCPSTNRGA